MEKKRVTANQYTGPRYEPSEWMPMIVERLHRGEHLARILRTPGAPSRKTVLDWSALPEWSEEFSEAGTACGHVIAEEVIEISDGEGDPNRDRLRVDARKWLAGKVLPKSYGERVDLGVEPPTRFVIDLAPLLPTAERRDLPLDSVTNVP